MRLLDSALESKLEFLETHGACVAPHSGRTLVGHLLGVYLLLHSWGARQTLCDAGLFHSVYGTETYTSTLIDVTLRDAVCAVIGEEAEHLAFVFGMKTGKTFRSALSTALEVQKAAERGSVTAAGRDRIAAGSFGVQNRLTLQWEYLSGEGICDLANLAIANTVEQVVRGGHPPDLGERRFLLQFHSLALPLVQDAIFRLCPDPRPAMSGGEAFQQS